MGEAALEKGATNAFRQAVIVIVFRDRPRVRTRTRTRTRPLASPLPLPRVHLESILVVPELTFSRIRTKSGKFASRDSLVVELLHVPLEQIPCRFRIRRSARDAQVLHACPWSHERTG